MTLKGSKTVPIKGSTDKQMTTATFTITLDGDFLPLYLIYVGSTGKSLLRLKFPSSVSLSANPKQYSNEKEVVTVVNDIIIPHVKAESKRLKLSADHPSLLIIEVFKGQTTEAVLKALSDNTIVLQTVPVNFMHLFQHLDVQRDLNGYTKRFMEGTFIEWYTEQTTQAMDIGDGREVCLKGWKVSGIKQAVQMGLSNLPQVDPFEDIDPMFKGDADMKSIGPCRILEASKHVQEVGNINHSGGEEE